MSVAQDTFIYDGDCGLCTASVEWLRDRGDGSVTFAPASEQLLADAGVTAAQADAAAVLVTTDGRRFDGALAFGEVLRRSDKYDRNLLGRLILEQPSRTVAGWIYGFVAKNRHRLGGPTTCRTDR